ncbi:hypothetical protein BDW59DRAFT_149492 [Aspergillus cavernicola]|uniref:Uncharacterized protein n=1 Tax=Aspergillus cavernicola TaxID=176166 RepID=A0ABR4I3X7_9EURO
MAPYEYHSAPVKLSPLWRYPSTMSFRYAKSPALGRGLAAVILVITVFIPPVSHALPSIYWGKPSSLANLPEPYVARC